MTKSFTFFFFLALLCFSSPAFAVEPTHPHSLIPVPAEITWQEGQLVIDSKFNVIGSEEPRVQKAINRFVARLERRTGLTFPDARKPKPDQETLIIHCDTKGLQIQSVREDESYNLEVRYKKGDIIKPTFPEKRIVLSAPNPLGILRGLETLLQLVEAKGDKSFIPCVTIHDKPRFPWRGLLIDACRHWMPVEVIKRNLDGLAEAKMNVLHWHLSENQGFRVESKLYPKLQELGSDGNFYTQDQIREIVSYARDRGIRVIPEFDVPGHTTAWFPGYPELASAPGPYQIERKFGVFDPSMDPSKEEVYQFLDGFIGEMAALFPDEYFHIGGDEVNGKQWNMNPKIQRFMAGHNLKTNDDLQTYFNSRLEKILTRHHKKMMGWDEILHPDLPKTILVHSWRGVDGLADSAKKGYDGILSNGYYLDLAQPASVHYLVDPLPTKSDLTPEQKSHVLGGEACMWSELVSSETIDSRLWPRTLAVAERLWSPASIIDLDDLYRRMEIESFRLEDLGLTHLSNYLPMLKHLANGSDLKPFKVLADVVEPVKNYQRHRSRVYTWDFPLNRLVDTTRVESGTARAFRAAVDIFLKDGPRFGNADGLFKNLKTWEDNHKTLGPLLEKSDLTAEAVIVSQDLSFVGQLGLKAVAFLKSGNPPNSVWRDKALQVLDRAQEPHAEVQTALIPAVRKLVLAASQQDKLKTMTGAEWNKFLDEQVEAAKPKGW